MPAKTRRMAARLSDEERELDAAAASALGESLSDFFHRAGQTRAQEALVIHPAAVSFYERFGFRGLDTAPRTLTVTLAEREEAG